MGVVYVALGGAVGAAARYGITGWVHRWAPATFPWGTLAVNVMGSLLLGFAYRYLEATTVSAETRQFVTIGLLGAFTTFSTFSYEAVALLQDGEWPRALAYVFGSVVVGLAAVFVGFRAATAVLELGR